MPNSEFRGLPPTVSPGTIGRCACGSEAYLFCYGVPILVTFAHVHPFPMEEAALFRNQKDIADKFAHCKINKYERASEIGFPPQILTSAFTLLLKMLLTSQQMYPCNTPQNIKRRQNLVVLFQ